MAVKFDVYLYLAIFLAYPVVAFTWKALAGVLASSGIPGLDRAGQGIAGVV